MTFMNGDKNMVRSKDINPGDWIKDGDRELYVVYADQNSMGSVVLRCSYVGPGAYPAISLLLDPNEELELA
jgi:hypothetical protein